MSFAVSRLVFVLSLMTSALALTQSEYFILKYNLHQSIRNTSAFTIDETDDGNYKITISGVPEHETSDCYNTDMNCCRPNARICTRAKSMVIPRSPQASTTETYCTPMGSVGFATSGTAFYNHLEADCVDVNSMPEGTFDDCNGHPSPHGEYHFHRAPNTTCLGVPNDGVAHIIGVAEDGFAIYDSDVYNGAKQVLDQCGGFMPDNDPSRYRYVSLYGETNGKDHVIPCFKGIPLEPRCCDCLECGLVQLPNCTNRRGPNARPDNMANYFGGRSPPSGGRGPPGGGRGPPGGGLGGPPSGGQGFPFGNRPRFGFRPPNSQGSPFGQGRPEPGQGFQSECPGEKRGTDRQAQPQNTNRGYGFFSLFFGQQQQTEQRPGECTREQLQQARPQQPQTVDCSTCDVCVPAGGYQSFANGRKYTLCRRQCQGDSKTKSTVTPPKSNPSPGGLSNSQLRNLIQQLLRLLGQG